MQLLVPVFRKRTAFAAAVLLVGLQSTAVVLLVVQTLHLPFRFFFTFVLSCLVSPLRFGRLSFALLPPLGCYIPKGPYAAGRGLLRSK